MSGSCRTAAEKTHLLDGTAADLLDWLVLKDLLPKFFRLPPIIISHGASIDSHPLNLPDLSLSLSLLTTTTTICLAKGFHPVIAEWVKTSTFSKCTFVKPHILKNLNIKSGVLSQKDFCINSSDGRLTTRVFIRS